jgi:small conductance mechanosensitive channel
MQAVEWLQEGRTWLIQNGLEFAQSLLAFIVILIIGKIAISMTCKVVYRVLHNADRVSEILEKFTVDTLAKVLWILVLLVGISSFGVDVGPLIAGLGVTGFILGFAFQESLGNLAAGLMLLLNEPFKVGDFVEAAGVSGAVQEMNLMATTLTSPDNKKIMVPNRNIWGGNITNYSAMETRRVDLVVGISYAANIGHATTTIQKVVNGHDLVIDDPEPVIEVVEMAGSSVNLVVRPWCNTADYWTVFFDLQRAVKEALDAEGIEIPFPQLDVHHHNQA